ncbi:MAG: M18 family aminopeptidase, partial [Clostridia bacterium]|nr:M18 family aminopeptidase [Clostridia bacterium]
MEHLFDFIASSPTPFHAAAHAASLLENAGFEKLEESDAWRLQSGKGYFVLRNSSSLIAFRIPDTILPPKGMMVAAAHLDSPALKIKENAALPGPGGTLRLSCEKYGGMIFSSWFDRPLSIAGRVMVRSGNGVATRLVDFGRPCALIPNVAIHMNRSANDGYSYNPAVDLLPLYGIGLSGDAFREELARRAGCEEADVLSSDLILYNPARGYAWNGLVSAPRLDDLECAYAVLA